MAEQGKNTMRAEWDGETGRLKSVDFIPPVDDGTEIVSQSPIVLKPERPSKTTESKDPTLRVIESEFAIFGLSRNIGHVPDRHVWGD